jgi:rubrerythrin
MKKQSQHRAKTPGDTSELVGLLRKWQEIEDGSVTSTSQIMASTKNPFIRLVMEIIRQDSVMHKKVQQFMIDSVEKQAVSLTPEELGEIWDAVERHAEMEKETIRLAEELRKNCRLFVQRHLLTYLVEDERLHDRLLGQLEDFKQKIYPYA